MYQIMTAGPTQVRENVRMARSLECTNPDLDPAFFDFYEFTGCDRGVLYGNRIFWCAQYDSWNDFCQHFCNAPGGGGRMSGDPFYGSACAENKVSVFCSLFVCHWCDRFAV